MSMDSHKHLFSASLWVFISTQNFALYVSKSYSSDISSTLSHILNSNHHDIYHELNAYLPGPLHYVKCFTCLISLNPHHSLEELNSKTQQSESRSWNLEPDSNWV